MRRTLWHRSFNPRAPRGARQAGRDGEDAPRRFQPTRPARGATRLANKRPALDDVSTHAPREGRDRPRRHGHHTGRDVSTHAPREGRDPPARPFCGSPRERFQPTRPARGATSSYFPLTSFASGFNPRAPRGARPPRPSPPPKTPLGFNPRAPRGARRADSRLRGRAFGFNPRAPRGARRRRARARRNRPSWFQPTRHARGATL